MFTPITQEDSAAETQSFADIKAESGFDTSMTGYNDSEGENKFKETLERYYTEVVTTDSEETAINEADTLKYFESKSSSYYKESQINFDKTIK